VPALRRAITSRRRFEPVPVLERLTEEQVALFAVHRPYFPGVEIRARLSRRYLHGAAMAHVLGYMGGISVEDQQRIDQAAYAGTTHIGKSAVERAFEEQLHGAVGREEVLVNAHGRRMQVLGRGAARPGRDLLLTIDIEAQLAAWEAMQDRRGAVVAIDPRNGEVLVLVSAPSFDPTAMSTGMSRPDFLARPVPARFDHQAHPGPGRPAERRHPARAAQVVWWLLFTAEQPASLPGLETRGPWLDQPA